MGKAREQRTIRNKTPSSRRIEGIRKDTTSVVLVTTITVATTAAAAVGVAITTMSVYAPNAEDFMEVSMAMVRQVVSP